MCVVTKIDPKGALKPIVSPVEAMAPWSTPVDTGTQSTHAGTPELEDERRDDSDSSYKPTPPSTPTPTRRTRRRLCGPRPKHAHLVTHHNYHDHAADPVGSESLDSHHQDKGHKHQAHSMLAFPLKLYEMLERVEAEGMEDVVSWQSHGRCFVVHNVAKFKELLPNYFKLSKIASFQRQLNLYGFQR